jgi:glycosyltransferase involved in cell wall biosynthesis
MKIAFIGQKGIPTQTGGVERQVEDLAVNLVKEGHEVFVYARSTYNTENLKEYKGVKIITVPSIPSKNLDAISATFFACLDLVRRKYDIIHFQSIGPASLLPLAKILKPRTPIVFTFHCQDYYQRKWGAFARAFLKLGEQLGNSFANRTIVTSLGLTAYAKNAYHKNPIYIPSSAKINELTAANEIKKWGLEKENYIAYIGRLVRHKGVHYLIQAYKELKTDKKLVIVGDGSYTDDYVKELHDLAEGDTNIIFTGNQNDLVLKELFSNAAVFVQPSESEGLSFALLEGMAYSRPCLVSDIEPNYEALADTGVYFKNTDYADLRDKLQYLLNDPQAAKNLGQAAFERVKKEYNADDISKQTIDLYQSMLKA